MLKAEGIRVSLVNSNPATIMTDPEFADATYVEPITTETLEKVIAIQRPDAVLPTLGGQTALNAAVALHDQGVLHRYNVELIGASIDAIRAGEDRERFKEIVTGLGAEVPRSQICRDLDECVAVTEDPRLPGRDPALASPSAASAPASREPKQTCGASPGPAWTRARPTRSCSRRASSAGRNSSSS